jgi:16S rRNA (cytidine1402-2'-O)-methyltransferase
MSEANHTPQKGVLYVVATPIGNRDDITLRALDVLQMVDLIAAEDTRKSGRLLAHRGINKPLTAYHEHNEKKKAPQLIRKLLDGASIALISNAGTPSVSDPGYRLIAAAIKNMIKVTPIPGVTAATAAASVSGLPTDTFTFVGFAPKKKGKRITFLKALDDQPGSLIFYESPKRIVSLLQDIISCLGDRDAMLAREMTKLHEEFLRGRLTHILNTIKARPMVKGECTLMVAGCDSFKNVDMQRIRNMLKTALENETGSLSDIARTVARKHGLPKKTVYAMALDIRGQKSEARGQRSEDRGQKTEVRK